MLVVVALGVVVLVASACVVVLGVVTRFLVGKTREGGGGANPTPEHKPAVTEMSSRAASEV